MVAAMARFPKPIARRLGARPWLAALVAIFWIAQLHGIQHGISHLGAAPGMGDRTAPHTLVCTDCVASAEAGAAPLVADIALIFAASAAGHEALPTLPILGRLFTAAYRARAPPVTSI